MGFFDQVLEEAKKEASSTAVADAPKENTSDFLIISDNITVDSVPDTVLPVESVVEILEPVSDLAIDSVISFDEEEKEAPAEELVIMEETPAVIETIEEEKEEEWEVVQNVLEPIFVVAEKVETPAQITETTSLADTISEMLAKISANEKGIMAQIENITKKADALAEEQKRLKLEEKTERDSAKKLEMDKQKIANLRTILEKELAQA